MSSFRVALLRVSDQLTMSQLEFLKFLSRCILPNSRIDKIRSSLDLFNALEERGKLSADNTSFLHLMLNSADYNEARRELTEFPPGTFEIEPTFLFYECLLKIAMGLESGEFDHVKYFFKDQLKQNVQKIYTATGLFQLLIQRRIVTSTDLKQLYFALVEVGRADLCDIVNKYLQQIQRQPYQQLSGGAVPSSLYTGPQQLAQPMEETPLNESNPQLFERYSSSSSSSLSPLSPPSRAGSGTSTLASMGEPALTSPPSGIGSLPSRTSLDSSQHQGGAAILANNGQSFTANRKQLPHGHQENAVGNNVAHLAHYNPQPHYAQQYSAQVDSQYRGVHPESEQSFPVPGGPPQTNYHVVYPNTQQSNYGGHHYPERQPSYPIHSPPSTQTPEFRIGGEGLYPPQRPRGLAAVFNMEEEKQQQSRNQQLQSELARKDSELRIKEDNIMEYQQQLMGMQARINSVADQHEGKERDYQLKISELESILKRMTTEAELQRKEMQNVHQQLQVSNPQSSQDDDDYYKMGQSPHGVCLIINNYEFHHIDPDKQHPRRNGADVDVHNLTQTFKYLRYKVETRENLTSTQMQEELLRMANRSHTQYDSFICCILTHGEQGVVHGSDCEAVNLNDLAGVMKMCPSLLGKPKLFFIQACRGDQENKGFELPERDAGGGPYHNTIPQEADFYFGFATPTGSSAYRSRRYGSWFISEVCQVFIKHSYTHDLGAMMVKVNKRVSDAYTKDGYKQAPESVNRLRFQVHFFRFIKGIGH